jgi:hypothetical protein
MIGAEIDVHEPAELIAQLRVLGERLRRASETGGEPDMPVAGDDEVL